MAFIIHLLFSCSVLFRWIASTKKLSKADRETRYVSTQKCIKYARMRQRSGRNNKWRDKSISLPSKNKGQRTWGTRFKSRFNSVWNVPPCSEIAAIVWWTCSRIVQGGDLSEWLVLLQFSANERRWSRFGQILGQRRWRRTRICPKLDGLSTDDSSSTPHPPPPHPNWWQLPQWSTWRMS